MYVDAISFATTHLCRKKIKGVPTLKLLPYNRSRSVNHANEPEYACVCVCVRICFMYHIEYDPEYWCECVVCCICNKNRHIDVGVINLDQLLLLSYS